MNGVVLLKIFQKYSILILFVGFVDFIFFISVINARKNIDISGTVIKSNKVILDKSNNDRYGTEYTIKTNNGNEISYEADNNDNSLQRDLSIGTFIDKKRGNLDYTVNGKIIRDFPKGFYLGGMKISITIMILGFVEMVIMFVKRKYKGN